MEQMRNTYSIYFGKLERVNLLGNYKHRWERIILRHALWSKYE
jgi:hypothetical protein